MITASLVSFNKPLYFHSQLDFEFLPWQNELTKMDPASASELREILSNSNTRMDRQEEHDGNWTSGTGPF